MPNRLGRMAERATVPRGRHAPPLEARQSVQRDRLLAAAAAGFARAGYAEACARPIAREAGGSKATFCGRAGAAAGAAPRGGGRAGAVAVLEMLASRPDEAQTLGVEVLGAGEGGAGRRDWVRTAVAEAIDAENAAAARRGTMPRFAPPHDAFA